LAEIYYTMKTFLSSGAGAALVMLGTVFSASGESATFGWHTTTSIGSTVSQVYMRGPFARNKAPEKKGPFKGEFLSRAGEWQSKLVAVYKLSADNNGELHSRKVDFAVAPPSNSDAVETNGWRGLKVHFATESLSFEPEESFVLVFKSKLSADPAREAMEIVTVRITKVFGPS
jgi:hypothetical protein